MNKPVVFSGIQPTGNLHIGNYLGAVKNWVDIQNSGEYQCYFCIVDYHSITGNRTSDERRQQIVHTAAELIAAGIDPKKSVLFVQSHVPEHTELGWIFNSVTPMAELERMTQFKDKAKVQKKNVNVGLFTYPVLQAADILLYHAAHVPVGEDQIQHVELTRDIAKWFNKKYKEYFPKTKALVTKESRVKSLLDPTKKMSKSLGLNHVIELADEPEIIHKKLKKAVTASTGGGKNPGVENLLGLLKEFADEGVYTSYAQAEKDGSIRYGDLKKDLARSLDNSFEQFRIRRADLLADTELIGEILVNGATQASAVAKKTMETVRMIIGVR